jgi:hypothetical protein
MDTDETQIKAPKDYLLQPVTEQTIGAAFEAHNVPGYLINLGCQRVEYKRMVF